MSTDSEVCSLSPFKNQHSLYNLHSWWFLKDYMQWFSFHILYVIYLELHNEFIVVDVYMSVGFFGGRGGWEEQGIKESMSYIWNYSLYWENPLLYEFWWEARPNRHYKSQKARHSPSQRPVQSKHGHGTQCQLTKHNQPSLSIKS